MQTATAPGPSPLYLHLEETTTTGGYGGYGGYGPTLVGAPSSMG